MSSSKQRSAASTLTKGEQAEIRMYLAHRFDEKPELDLDELPKWLADLERIRRSHEAGGGIPDIPAEDAITPVAEAVEQVGIAQDFYDDAPDIDRDFHLQKAQALALISIARSLELLANKRS